MRDFVAFRTMLTPLIIEALWLGTSALLIWGGVSAFVSGDDTLVTGLGLAVAVLGPLLLRLCCEVVIVIFKIHERLGEIVAELGHLVDATEDSLEAAEDLITPTTTA